MRSATKNKVGKDPAKIAWLHQQTCAITGEKRNITVHHVRRYGSLRDDARAIPLVDRLHMLASLHPRKRGEPCVEQGKTVFQNYWKVDLEELVERYQRMWETHCLDEMEREKGIAARTVV